MVNRKNKEINYLTSSIKVVETQWPCFTFDHLDLKLDQLINHLADIHDTKNQFHIQKTNCETRNCPQRFCSLLPTLKSQKIPDWLSHNE